MIATVTAFLREGGNYHYYFFVFFEEKKKGARSKFATLSHFLFPIPCIYLWQ
jgi:hypothetical protein